jgi:hypothetical protein
MSCASCNQDQYVADRADTFRAAHALLKDMEWEDGIEVTPIDVIEVARFLSGDGAT